MKIRIKGNSVRFRLTKTEVETFCETGKVSENTSFGDKTLTYTLESKQGIKVLEANYIKDSITLYLPIEQANGWATNTKVGFNNNVAWNNEQALSLLVEKDFTCLDNTIEDQSDNYPNPKLNY